MNKKDVGAWLTPKSSNSVLYPSHWRGSTLRLDLAQALPAPLGLPNPTIQAGDLLVLHSGPVAELSLTRRYSKLPVG